MVEKIFDSSLLKNMINNEVSANFIVTRNTNDFSCSKVKPLTPHEFLEIVD